MRIKVEQLQAEVQKGESLQDRLSTLQAEAERLPALRTRLYALQVRGGVRPGVVRGNDVLVGENGSCMGHDKRLPTLRTCLYVLQARPGLCVRVGVVVGQNQTSHSTGSGAADPLHLSAHNAF